MQMPTIKYTASCGPPECLGRRSLGATGSTLNGTCENMYLDQQNETVTCVANCTFKGMNEGKATDNSDGNSGIVIGPDAFTALGQTKTILRLNQGFIEPYTDDPDDTNFLDVRFDTPPGGGNPCNCSVALGDGMVDLASGFVSTNQSTQVAGPISFGGPQAGPNADLSNGIGPLNLSPSEIGMGVTTTAPTFPGKAGVKLSVQCTGNHDGKVNLVVLAGTDNTPYPVLSNIGSNVQACL